MKFYIELPFMLALIIPAIIAIIILVKINFIKFADIDKKKEFAYFHKGRRIFVGITRSLIAICLLIALSSPYTLKEEISQGDYSLKILVDNSTSMQLFDKKVIDAVYEGLKEKIPVTKIQIGSANDSEIGDSIINNMYGDDNLLLISDGQNTKGKDLSDVMFFASSLNTTISAIKLTPINTDYSVVIEGPSEAIIGTPSEFYIKINRAGNSLSYDISVTIDNTPVNAEKIENDLYKVSKTFSQGYHKITASIDCVDHFKENNIYYKTFHVLPKPKILYLSQKSSRFVNMLKSIYEVDEKDSIPEDLGEYSTLIIDDMAADRLDSQVDKLTDYIINDGGLMVIGGENSYDRGNYANSIFETILPVKVGEAGYGGELATNIVIVIDISGSTGQGFSSTSENKKVDVEKSLALEIIKGISLFDRVGVVAFNHKAYQISPVGLLGEIEDNITKKISMLVDGGGTLVYSGLKKAEYMMDGSLGSKNIILISDGVDSIPDLSTTLATRFASQNIRLYTVGVGEATNSAFLQTLAVQTGAQYFEPTETQKLNILFGDRDELPPEDIQSLVLFNTDHFITKGLDLNAQITGFNYVVKKSSAQMLVSMGDGKPIVTVWRYGLGRVVALSTDDGEKWASPLLGLTNSKLLMRSINWAIGDPQKKLSFYVKMSDVNLGETSKITVKSDKTPVSNVLKFEKADEKTYLAYYTPQKEGYEEFFNAVMAVNSPAEYRNTGFNDYLNDLVKISDGQIFEPNEFDKIVEFIKQKSVRMKTIPNYFRWPFIALALAIFILEILIRKIIESMRR